MPPTIVLVRHAQALHNETQDYSIPDPGLTDLGIQQCAQLRHNLFQRFSSFEGRIAVIASPMIRTLQTASLAADWLIERGVKIEADADWQELTAKPCDTGSPLSLLPLVKDNQTKYQFTHPCYDFSSVSPLWPDKTDSPIARDLFSYTRPAVLRRGRRCLEKLSKRPEDLIFVFSHSGFLRSGVSEWWYFNADYRIFTFDEGLGLKIDESTLEGGMGWSWNKKVELGTGVPEDVEKEIENGDKN
ncbi:histidine phosphatase superfamily [Trichoderma chlorosporum]